MRFARGLILLLAAGSAAGAALAVRKTVTAPPARLEKPARPDVEILVMHRAIAAGETVALSDLRWQGWPGDSVPSDAISRRRGASIPPFKDAVARYPLIQGEPVAEAKLVRPGEGSFAAALIAPGKRAIAVPMKEESAAGGLIQPNDRVDVLWTRQMGDRRKERPRTRTVLRGIKVLAIGNSVLAQNNNAAARTATLELTPEQARIVESAKASGEISLALIPISDIAALGEIAPDVDWTAEDESGIKIMKFGRSSAGARENWGQ